MRVLRTVALVVVALVALLVGGTWVFLQTRWGGETVRRLALPRLNAAIAGRIAAERFRFGGDRIVLEGAALHDPAGAQVLSVERLEIAFSPLALLGRRVEISKLAIEGPRLWLVAEKSGTNLARALAPRHPTARAAPPAPSQTGGPGWVVDVAGIALSDGAFAYVGPTGKRVAHIDDLATRGHVRLARDGDKPDAHDVLELDLATDARGAHLAASGALDLTTLRARDPGLIVRGEGIVLAELFAAAPSSHFGFVLKVEGGGPTLAELDGRLTLRVPEGELAGQTLGPIAFSLQAAAGRYQLADLKAAFPGLKLTGEATATSTRVDGRLRVEARDLAATARSLAPPRRPPPLGLAGHGRLDLAISGPLAGPSLRVAARFPTLRLDANTLDEVHLSATVPDLSRPTRATVDAGAAQATLGGQPVRALALRLDAAGKDLVAELRAAAPYPLALAATARRGSDDSHLTLTSFALRYPEATWTLTRPARIAFDDGRLTVRTLALKADHQTIAVDLTRTAHRLDGRVTMARIDLARLPRVLVPQALGLRGEVDLDARVDEQAQRPRLALTLALRRLVLHQRTVGDLRLQVDGDGGKPLTAALDATGLGGGTGGSLSVKLTTPLSLRTLLRRPPTTARLLRTPLAVTGDLERLPLKTIALVLGRKPEPEGTLSSHFEISGSADDPRGQLALDVAGASVGQRFPPTDARVEVDLSNRSVDARVRVVRRQHALLALTAHLGAGLDTRGDLERIASAPLEVKAVIGPLALQRIGLPASERQPPRVLKGKVHADLTLDGTLRAPRLVAHAQLQDIFLDKALVGAGTLEVNYARHALRVETRLASTNGGTLNLAAGTTADLGYPAIRALDPDKLVLDARLDAKEFDLQGLSGMTPGLRTVAGRLSAAATLRGTLDDPRVAGRLEWRDGRLAFTGYGEYQAIHLALHGDEKSVRIDELVGRSGRGNARVTGGARHVDGKGYEVDAKANVTQFPLYTEGQPLAEVTIDAAVKGTVSPRVSRLAVDLDQARIALSDAKRKNLQTLATPSDVVLVDGSEPLNKAQAAKLAKLEAELRDEPAPGTPAQERARKPRTVITIDAPRRIWVTGQDAKLELGLEPGFRVVMGEKTRVIGTVHVQRARIDVFGRRFDVRSDSTVKFNGAPDFPDIDVTATHKNTTEKVTVLATVKGTPDKMSVKVTSPDRPELNESQLYTLLITGHLQAGGSGTNSGSSSATAQAASLLGGVLASQLQKTLAGRLPLDVLTIDTGGQGLAGTQLEAGRYVTDRFYVGYIGRVGADPNRYVNRNAVHLEYQLTARWELEGEYGDVGTGSADLMWKKNY